MANRPITSWNESAPADSNAFSEGDNRIREMKKQIREIFEEDHIIESSGKGSTWGYHKKVTLIEQGSDSYVVDATNNKLDFDIGGSELNATIGSATYTSMGSTQADAGSLCKAIHDAVVAAEGAGTYTVVHDGAKMTITRSAGTLNILWKTGTNGADGTDVHIGSLVGYSDLADDTGALTYTADYVVGDPTAVADTFMLYTKQVNSKCELFMQDEDANIVQLTSAGSFIGGITNEIRMWSGTLANIPTGWTLCDGTGGTINLVAKFISCVASNLINPGSTGGSDSITLVLSNLPDHAHGNSTSTSSGEHTHGYTWSQTNPVDTPFGGTVIRKAITSYQSVTDSSAPTHNHGTVATSSTGSGSVYDNRPSYYELAFIQRS